MTVSTPPPSVEELREALVESIARALTPHDPDRLVLAGDPLGNPSEYPACMLSLPLARKVAALPGLLSSTAKDKARIVELEVALRTIRDRDFNCSAHQHGMAASGLAARALLSPISEGEGE